jgi:probable ATP-dependent RNA helicase DDX46
MQQRRERVEKWRAEQARLKGLEEGKTQDENTENQDLEGEGEKSKKKWTLDDEFDGDDDEDEEDNYDPNQVELDDRELELPKKKEEVEEMIIKNLPILKRIGIKANKVEEAKKETELKAKQEVEKEKLKEDLKKEIEASHQGEDVDPLDAYMKGIDEEVKKLRGSTIQKGPHDKKVSFVVGVAKKSSMDINKGN